MNNTEALMKLADEYAQTTWRGTTGEHAAARVELRLAIDATLAQPAEPVRQPLTNEQIRHAIQSADPADKAAAGWIWRRRIKWARAVERALAARWGVTLAEQEGGAA